MINKKEIKYQLLKYIINNIEKNQPVNLVNALTTLGHKKYVDYARDIGQEMENEGLIETLDVSLRRIVVTRITLDGIIFIEEHLKDNSNLDEFDKVIKLTEHLDPVNIQLRTARKYLTTNDGNDYRNAIKEAIGAVETVLQIALKDDKITVGKAVSKLRSENKIHPAFSKGISALYGFNSNVGGVRHGLKEGDWSPNYTEAKFLVGIYSAFVNYIIEEFDLLIAPSINKATNESSTFSK